MTLALPTYDGTPETLQFILDLIAQAIPSSGIATGPRIVSGGKKNIATSESTSSTSYTTLTTPDTVTVVLPTDGLIAVSYQALWQNTVASNARAAIFLNTTQVKIATSGGAPSAHEATGSSATNVDSALATTHTSGLLSANSGVAMTEVTTGEIMSRDQNTPGGPLYIFADPGTYNVSIKFKNVAAGTLTAKSRHLWVAAYSFS